MALMHLPNELLDNIILHALPEGFESLALTCKAIYALCTPFIEHHNRLRAHFQDFTYYDNPNLKPSFNPHEFFTRPYGIRSAFHLIAQIAVEPVVARYIREADFMGDSRFTRGIDRGFLTDPHRDENVARLLADSSYLKEAGLDWKEYYAAIEADLDAACYSQHAAAFVLTLLPNLEVLKLPRYWKPVDATDKLIDAVIHRARQAYLPYDRPSIAQVTRFEPYAPLLAEARFDLDWATPFLALPHVRSFRGPSCVGMGDSHGSIASRYPFFEALETVHFINSSIDEVAIADFLKHTPCLKTLWYSHSTKENGGPQDWDLCRFVTAIEREVGSHLVDLSVSIHELRGSIAPGKASMRGFQRLQKLEFPLEIATCNLTAAESTDHKLDYSESFISDLVPASVSQLSLLLRGTDHHEKALDIMFGDFAAKKDSQVPALKEIHLSCLRRADNAHKEQCAKLAAETEKVGVVLRLREWQPELPLRTWDGNDVHFV